MASKLTLRSPAAALRGEAGNMPATVVYAVFTALFMGIIVTSLMSAMGAASQTKNTAAASQTISAVAGEYAALAAKGAPPTDGELCISDQCASVTAGKSPAGTRTVTVKATVGGATATRTLTVPEPAGAMVTGFTADGKPVWGPLPGPSGSSQEENK
ncbi:hypothetical protein [Arthrobacter caoxuetaonis]|uniref:Uncharacterized protein n=1 Tax=Arthrobacter caoxuetaonis TaxID=2886935 RepID=A0A9X1MHB0_9MICC|nr:hypothetical protein [Arthrobacter caoxuetaonis]MCC3299826.1 hypothetical protein [Arthrobacter caoxuetaonis]USQ59274.1 hypothetical protein NF551_16960 [Arthrobacter caoxuetaonis]